MIIRQQNRFWWYQLNGLIRQLIVRGILPPYHRKIILNEYPKSGGTWLGQLLSELAGISFPRNQLPVFTPSLLHGHYLSPAGMNDKTVILWRDGRDVLVSQYFYSVFSHKGGLNNKLVSLTRSHLKFGDYSNIKTNLPQFIEYTFDRKVSPRFSWTEFVNVWADREVVHVKYESLRRDAFDTLSSTLKKLEIYVSSEEIHRVIEKYSFENQTKRKAGSENMKSFLRKGIVGDWKNNFTLEARQLFSQYAGDELIKLGYEKDHSWV